ncbi:hypothetical protein [Candidatus Leptofilum sp.]|uniref:hypothetical protein n=1 Tax=Candidatus Leptofilum sp. TaxID=3241576 RepID=UPI003B5CB576
MSEFTILDWFVIGAAIGQICAGLGAVVAAILSFITVFQIRQQLSQSDQQVKAMDLNNELQRAQYQATFGPKIMIEWKKYTTFLPKGNIIDFFPLDAQEVAKHGNNSMGQICRELKKWWASQSPMATPYKYISLDIKNVQNITQSGTAVEVRIKLKVTVKNHNFTDFPETTKATIRIDLDVCEPGSHIIIPIRVEGVPVKGFIVEIMDFDYEFDEQRLKAFSGRKLYSLGEDEFQQG